jgi:hypothetical protein
MPGRAGVTQSRWPVAPSTVARQSKQAPIPQKIPRGAPPRRVVRQDRMPACHSAAATVCPRDTGTEVLSKVNVSAIGHLVVEVIEAVRSERFRRHR